MRIEDLPNGGRNLRVYTYDPPGTPYYKPDGFIYNTGHYDLCLAAGPCSQSDPKGFMDWASMSAYVQSRQEFGLVLVTRDDLNVLCALPPKGVGTLYNRSCGGVVSPAPGSGFVPQPVNVGTTVQGALTGADLVPAPTPTQSAVAAAIAPQLTPGTPGSVPAGTGGTGTGTGGGLTGLYRFILHDPSNPAGPWSTGANYPGCSQVNVQPCDARAFATEDEAIAYALEHGEIPYQVLTAGEPWALMQGTVQIDPSRILSAKHGIGLGTVALIAAALWFLSGR